MRLPVETLSLSEKLDVLEQVWSSLRERPEEVPAPGWHGAVLADRVERLNSGAAHLADWDDAKRRFDGLGR